MSRRRRRNDWIPGAVITIIVIMLSVVFMGLLAMTKMIPTIYMLIIGIVLAVIAAIIWLLVWHTQIHRPLYWRNCFGSNHDCHSGIRRFLY